MIEWKLNIFRGCSNNCLYCYGKHLALENDLINTEADWCKPSTYFEVMRLIDPITCEYRVEKSKNLEEIFGKEMGKIIFPAKHGITHRTFKPYMETLLKILNMGYNVYITTKPDFILIKELCDKTLQWVNKIEFLFTITSMDDKILKYWESNAPNYKSRLDSLKYAFEKGFKTGVSIQPYLDDPIPLIKEVAPYCSEEICIGEMIFDVYKHPNHKPSMNSIIENLKLSDIIIKDLYIDIKDVNHPKMPDTYTAIKFKTGRKL